MAAAYASTMTSSFFTAHFPLLLEPYLSTSPFFCKFFIIDWIYFLVSSNSSISFVCFIAGSSCIRCSIPVFISAPFFDSFLRLLFGSFLAPFWLLFGSFLFVVRLIFYTQFNLLHLCNFFRNTRCLPTAVIDIKYNVSTFSIGKSNYCLHIFWKELTSPPCASDPAKRIVLPLAKNTSAEKTSSDASGKSFHAVGPCSYDDLFFPYCFSGIFLLRHIRIRNTHYDP